MLDCTCMTEFACNSVTQLPIQCMQVKPLCKQACSHCGPLLINPARAHWKAALVATSSSPVLGGVCLDRALEWIFSLSRKRLPHATARPHRLNKCCLVRFIPVRPFKESDRGSSRIREKQKKNKCGLAARSIKRQSGSGWNCMFLQDAGFYLK